MSAEAAPPVPVAQITLTLLSDGNMGVNCVGADLTPVKILDMLCQGIVVVKTKAPQTRPAIVVPTAAPQLNGNRLRSI